MLIRWAYWGTLMSISQWIITIRYSAINNTNLHIIRIRNQSKAWYKLVFYIWKCKKGKVGEPVWILKQVMTISVVVYNLQVMCQILDHQPVMITRGQSYSTVLNIVSMQFCCAGLGILRLKCRAKGKKGCSWCSVVSGVTLGQVVYMAQGSGGRTPTVKFCLGHQGGYLALGQPWTISRSVGRRKIHKVFTSIICLFTCLLMHVYNTDW